VGERSLRSYLLMPRPGDLVKAWIFPVAFALGVLADGASAAETARAAVVWGALELLIYQARYQWNDIRGFDADQRHPDRVSRGRLPGPPSRGPRNIRASALVAVARLGLVALLAAVLPRDRAALLAVALAVFGTAVLYEALRARSTGAGGRVPSPLNPDILALWMVAGAGYAVRGLAGLSSAVAVIEVAWLPLAATVALWSFGVAFVTSRWALEALAFGRLDSAGGLSWRASAEQAREHTLALIRWVPEPPAGAAAEPGDGSLADWRPLAGRTSLAAPWNLAALLSGCAAAMTGRLLAGPAGPGGAALAALAGGAGALLVLAAGRRRWRGLLLVGAGLLALAAIGGWPRPGLVALPWLAILAAHLFFTAQSPRTLAHPLRSAARRPRSAPRASGRRQGLKISALLPR
jgi:hypothetical protein